MNGSSSTSAIASETQPALMAEQTASATAAISHVTGSVTAVRLTEAEHELGGQHRDRDLAGVERDLVRLDPAVVLPRDGADDGAERR